jgi:hypothetical protein
MQQESMKRNDAQKVSKRFIDRAKGPLNGPRSRQAAGWENLATRALNMDGQDRHDGSHYRAYPVHPYLVQCNVQPLHMQPIGAENDSKR